MTREEEKKMVAEHFAKPEVKDFEMLELRRAVDRACTWASSPAGTPYGATRYMYALPSDLMGPIVVGE